MHTKSAEEREPTSVPTVPLTQILHPYGIGIDCHSKFIQVCVLLNTARGVERHDKEFPTLWARMQEARDWAARIVSESDGAKLRYCIESTGCYHLPVLQSWGGIPSVVNPLLAGATRRKTDVLDAHLLAHHSITGLWPCSFTPSQAAQQLRVLWARRTEAVRLATRASNRINNIILRFGHTFGAELPMRSPIARGLLEALVQGKALKAQGVAPTGLPPSVRPVIAHLLKTMDDAQCEAKEAVLQAVQFVEAQTWPTGLGEKPGRELLRKLQTVPGVGRATAITWLAEVCDPRRFENSRQVGAFCGWDPSLKVSAGKVTSQTRRKGNARLHFALAMAAQSVLRDRYNPLGHWGASIQGRHRKGGYRKALGAVSRRIACGLWHVHRKCEDFSFAGYNLDTHIRVQDVPVEQMGMTPRQMRLLPPSVTTSQQLVDAYFSGTLHAICGLGDKTFSFLREWVTKHPLNANTKERDEMFDLRSGQARPWPKYQPPDDTGPTPPRGSLPPRRSPLTTAQGGEAQRRHAPLPDHSHDSRERSQLRVRPLGRPTDAAGGAVSGQQRKVSGPTKRLQRGRPGGGKA